jgi:hypothetical protein
MDLLSACVFYCVVYCNGLFPAAVYIHMCDTHEIARINTVQCTVQSMQTSERLRECLRKSSLHLPLQYSIY